MKNEFESIKKGLEEAVDGEGRRDKSAMEPLLEGVDQDFQDILERVMKDYDNALRNLKDR